MSEWQPIETAPDDGRAFLAINIYDCQWICTKLDGRIIGVGEAACSAAVGVARLATHWQPLPEPPKQP